MCVPCVQSVVVLLLHCPARGLQLKFVGVLCSAVLRWKPCLNDQAAWQ
jgi:hypothetical protein